MQTYAVRPMGAPPPAVIQADPGLWGTPTALLTHIGPGLGLLQVREVTVGVSDRFLITIKNSAGPSAARHARTVLSGLMGLAARHEAVRANPVRDVSKIVIERDDARSLLIDEVRRLRVGLRADRVAVGRDLPDLVDFMLGTGLRIGETRLRPN